MLGFSQKEQNVLIFLSVCFVIGLGIKTVQQHRTHLPETPSESLKPLIQTEIQETSVRSMVDSSYAISINKADIVELQQIPGVGAVIAKRIFDFRGKNGKFRSVDELMDIQGIGKRTLEKIRPFVTCD
jgi:competence protein ComEA